MPKATGVHHLTAQTTAQDQQRGILLRIGQALAQQLAIFTDQQTAFNPRNLANPVDELLHHAHGVTDSRRAGQGR